MSRVILVLVAAAGAALATLLLRERQRRRAAEQEATAQAQAAADADRRNREWLAVFGHELRSPLAAILGYAELLEDGTFGVLGERADDAVRRLRASAEQLVGLLEGMDARHFRTEEGAPAELDASAILRDVAATVAVEAEAHDVSIVVEGDDIRLFARSDIVARALRLALGAAIKVSHGATLRVAAASSPVPHILISGTRLDALRDDPDNADAGGNGPLTGAGLRLALARVTARQIGGGVSIDRDRNGTAIRVEVPPAAIDGAEDRP
jgi:signal transduction histidine kinase